MKWVVLVACFCLAWAEEDSQGPKPLDEADMFGFLGLALKVIEQPVDHFNIFDNRTWPMRYVMSDQYFKPGGPLFIEIGGEDMVAGYKILMGQTRKLAEKYDGMMVETEHRYYGNSLPFGIDYSTENLKWLTVEQALEDLAQFIEEFKSITPGLNNSKVIVRGCSYPGMLSTWLRIKYPHLVDIAYSTSAPLRVNIEYPEYLELVHKAYGNASDECVKAIRDGFRELYNLLETKDGRHEVREALKDFQCENIYDMLATQIMPLARYTMSIQNDTTETCNTLTSDQGDATAFQKLAKVLVVISNSQCEISEKTLYIEAMKAEAKFEEKEAEMEEKESKVDLAALSAKAWRYQSCTEHPTFQTRSRKNSKNPAEVDDSLETLADHCQGEFGKGFDENRLNSNRKALNRRYGGIHPKMSKVLTVQGDQDPYKELGIMESLGDDNPVIIMEGGHCVDYDNEYGRLLEDNDSPALRESKEKARDVISTWLDEIL